MTRARRHPAPGQHRRRPNRRPGPWPGTAHPGPGERNRPAPGPAVGVSSLQHLSTAQVDGLRYWSVPHDSRVDELLRTGIEVLISIRYLHPTFVQLQLDLTDAAPVTEPHFPPHYIKLPPAIALRRRGRRGQGDHGPRPGAVLGQPLPADAALHTRRVGRAAQALPRHALPPPQSAAGARLAPGPPGRTAGGSSCSP